MNKDPNTPIDLKMTLAVAGVIRNALGGLPHDQVRGIIEGIDAQIMAQLQPAETEAAAGTD